MAGCSLPSSKGLVAPAHSSSSGGGGGSQLVPSVAVRERAEGMGREGCCGCGQVKNTQVSIHLA